MIFPGPLGCRAFGGLTPEPLTVPPVTPRTRWDPDTPLTGSLSAEDLEQDFLSLWSEYLKGYFDGNQHYLNRAPVVFPLVDDFIFQQYPAPPQPLNDRVIIVTWSTSNPVKVSRVCEEKFFQLPFTLNFWMRVSGSNAGDGGPHRQIKSLGSLLYSLLANREQTYYLAQKGVHKIRPQSPVLVSSFTEPMRMVVVRGEIYYTCPVTPTDMEPEVLAVAGVTDETLTFTSGEEWKSEG